ncbi:MAG: hypothetical protein KatS3mg111_1799 [Pirellulaceae bacterium]|nr:MAG: hypothetical protein KatS3mg111_1799 [Pirellulaceae bacterium]
MQFRFTCPYCFHKTLVDQRYVGQSGPCVGCGKQVTVVPPPDYAAEQHDAPAVGSTEVQHPSVGRRKGVGRLLVRLLPLVIVGLGLSLMVGVAIRYVIPVARTIRQTHDRIACMNNLRQIARALNAYAAQYGSYPPPVVTREDGLPLYSWRVLILPNLGYGELYSQFALDQPWDSPTNSRLLPLIPAVFVCPAGDDKASGETSYFLVTGPGTIFPASGALRPEEISDGLGETLLVVEAAHHHIEWTRPGDLQFGLMNLQLGARGANTIGGYHADGATAVFADESPAWLPHDAPPALLQALFTADGGEEVDADLVRPGRP